MERRPEQQSSQIDDRKAVRFRGPSVVWRPIIKVGETVVLSTPSRSGHNIMVLGKEVPGTQVISKAVISIRNRNLSGKK